MSDQGTTIGKRSAGAQPSYKGVFAHLDFGDYKYREFPKMLHFEDGSTPVVKSKSEELEVIGQKAGTGVSIDDNKVTAQDKEINDLHQQLASANAALAAKNKEIAQEKGSAIVEETTGKPKKEAKPNLDPKPIKPPKSPKSGKLVMDEFSPKDDDPAGSPDGDLDEKA